MQVIVNKYMEINIFKDELRSLSLRKEMQILLYLLPVIRNVRKYFFDYY